MAVSIAKVPGADTVWGNKKVKVRTLTFSSNYATNGETVTAAQVGLRKIEQVQGLDGVAAASTPTTAVVLGAVINSTGSSVAIRSYESAATGLPLLEKTAEAYITGQNVRATFIGY